MAIPINTGRISQLYNGCNTNDNIIAVNRFEAQVIRNMHIDEDGIAYTRGGSRLLNETALAGAVTGIYEFRRPDGASFTSTYIVKAGTNLYDFDLDTGSATLITDLNTTNRPTFCTFQDGSSTSYVFIADGVNFVKYDGTTLTNADATEDYPWTAGNAPRYILVYDDRILAAGMDDEPYRVFVSDSLDGTNWKPSDTGTAIYWTIKSPAGDRITGLNSVYDFGVILQRNGVTIITEANANSDTSKQIKVSSEYGTTSHWSVQAIGNVLYFADNVHVYKGELRNAVENGLIVNHIDTNIMSKYRKIVNYSDIVSVYDSRRKEIQWGAKTTGSVTSDISLIYSIGRSTTSGPMGQVDVWSGWFDGDGYEPYTLANITYSESKYDLGGTAYTQETPLVIRGDSNGYLYLMDEDDQYKDEKRVSGTTTEHPIVSEIHTAAFYPSGQITTKRLRNVAIALYQYTNGSVTLYWKIDDRYRRPANGRAINYRKNVPYWNDDTGDTTQTWGSTLWMNTPVLASPISINAPFQRVQFVLICDGTNTKDRFAFGGGEFTYQTHGVRHNI